MATLKRLALSREQADTLRTIAESRFKDSERLARALEAAARARDYSNCCLFSVTYRRHLSGHPVTMRYARVYLDVFDDPRLDFLRPLID